MIKIPMAKNFIYSTFEGESSYRYITMRRFSNKYESIMSQEHDTALNAKLVLNYKHRPKWGRWKWEGGAQSTNRGKSLRIRCEQ